MDLEVMLVLLGLGGGLLSSLVGLGGGIIMAPLLLYVPPALGLPNLGMRAVAGITIVHGFVASAAGPSATAATAG